jgi:hypothetical protein
VRWALRFFPSLFVVYAVLRHRLLVFVTASMKNASFEGQWTSGYQHPRVVVRKRRKYREQKKYCFRILQRLLRLMLKFMQVVLCAWISTLMNNVLSNRFFQVYMGDKTSRWRRLDDGLPQGSVLALWCSICNFPTFRRHCRNSSSMPLTVRWLIKQIHFLSVKQALNLTSKGWMGILRRWKLQPNPAKTETCIFHLSSHDANRCWTSISLILRYNMLIIPNTLVSHWIDLWQTTPIWRRRDKKLLLVLT